MKRDVTGIGMPINEKELTELLSETKEILAVDIQAGNQVRNFNLVDLWNSQKQQRTALQRRRRQHLMN